MLRCDDEPSIKPRTASSQCSGREWRSERYPSINWPSGGISAAFLSRILNQERSLPSDKTILKLAEILDLEPAERLLIEAGRIPEEHRLALSRPLMPSLLRATGKLSETEIQELLKVAESIALKQDRKKETK